jgi:N-acyl-D-aspartate/D-glutamate deacylase
MTGLPARRFQLHDRGLLHEGYAADLVLFDPATIQDRATYADSTLPSTGIARVWVNGVLSYDANGATGNRSGRFLPRGPRPQGAQPSAFF